MKRNTLLSILLIVFTFSYAQDSKTTVGILPFSSIKNNKEITTELQEIVLEALNKKSNILTIDRSKETLLNKELDLQTSERSIASKKLVAQGKKMGADHLLIGTLISFDVIREKGSSDVYNASLIFSLQIIDVETGKIINQKKFNQNNIDSSLLGLLGNTDTKDDAKINAISNSKREIRFWLNEVYPPLIKVVAIEKRNKNGKPKTILITGVDNSLKVGFKLVLEETELIPNGTNKEPLRRIKKVATLVILEKQGDITVCKITDGEDTIEEKIKNGIELNIRE